MRNNKSIAPELNVPELRSAILGYARDGRPNQFHYVSNNHDYSLCAGLFPATNDNTSLVTISQRSINSVIPFHYNGALNYDAAVFDGRGRRFYARALMQF